MSQLLHDPDTTPAGAGHAREGRPRRVLCVTSFGLTDRGKVRAANEDCFLIAELRKALRVRQSNLHPPETRYGDDRGHLFLVADGMGGHQAGDRASALAVQTVEEFVLNTLKWFFHLRGPEEQTVLREFQEALRQADLRVCAEAAQDPDLSGMGTTLTLAYVLDSDLYVLHVGDSRCYLLRDGALKRLTHDHTLAGELVRHGQISPEEAAGHSWRHVLINAVGSREPGIQVEVHKAVLRPGDMVLLCSDGLTEMVTEDRLVELLRDEEPRRACERLVAEANERGGKDNITVIVSRFAEAEPAQG